jgi:hypothetical protein
LSYFERKLSGLQKCTIPDQSQNTQDQKITT